MKPSKALKTLKKAVKRALEAQLAFERAPSDNDRAEADASIAADDELVSAYHAWVRTL